MFLRKTVEQHKEYCNLDKLRRQPDVETLCKKLECNEELIDGRAP